jgi:hypothetical protein
MVGGPALAGPRWAGAGRERGDAVCGKKRRRWPSELGEFGLAAQKQSPSPFLIASKPLSNLDSNLNADSNLNSHSNKFQIKPKELQVSHTSIFIIPRNFI